MKTTVRVILSGFLGFIFVLAGRGGAVPEKEKFWPQWRGPHATGVAPFGNPPVEWAEDKNVQWKIEIPGKGSSSPIVWRERIFVTTAIPTGRITDAMESQKFALLAIDRRTGKVLWQRALREELPHEGTHATGSWASHSPVTDGTYVYAYFGSRGLYCLDMQGNLIWEKDLGKMTIKLGFGEASSPFLYADTLILNWDHEGQSFTTALDKKTGKELWKVNREEITSWTTPLVVEYGEKPQVITSATHRVRSYELATGRLIWESEGMTLNSIPSPVAADGMVFVTSGFRGNALLAIRLDGAQGNITNSEKIAWSLDQDTPYVPSPLLYDGTLYFLKSNSPLLSCFQAATGREYYRGQRLEGISNIYASPVGAAGRVYITGREGTTVVVQQGPTYKVLAVNKLGDGFDASPAVVDNEIYLRGTRYLYRISKE